MHGFGLDDEQVEESKRKYGDNHLTEKSKETFLNKLLGNFGDPMIRILCVALLLNVVFVIMHYACGIGDTQWYETAGIAAAVIIATVVSTVSEYKNENAFRKLQEEASQIRCKVFRNGDLTEIGINDIVKGDCVLLQSGDRIPADGNIINGSVGVDQAALNGESKEAVKSAKKEDHPEIKEDRDLLDGFSVFRGSVVCSGQAVMRVTDIGDKTLYGEIASELQQPDDRPSPLKLRLSALAGLISKFGYIGGVSIALVYILQSVFFAPGGVQAYFASGELWLNLLKDIVQAVIFAVIIIVMAVPEGLPLMIAIVSSMNMKKMLSDNVLVRRINGIETAGSLNILFSDKTGTITKGKLEAILFCDGSGKQYDSFDNIEGKPKDLLALALKKNNGAIMNNTGDKTQFLGGNPTDRALLSFVSSDESKYSEYKHISSIPFDSEKKYSAATVSDGKALTLIKGAPEKLLHRCRQFYDLHGIRQPLDTGMMNNMIDELAQRAIRVIAVAASDEPIRDDSLPEGDWTLIGIVGIRDDVRPESVSAIRDVHNAGVQTVMITGDRKETAVAIAREAGLLDIDDSVVLTSTELSKLSDKEITDILPRIRVIARALPSDKSRLVRISQDAGLVVGMTGDGVNDSPALKKADVGFAMGSGTEVAKEASDIVILDDNFISISRAILYGRTIFNNIRKFIAFQLAINISAVLVSFVMPLIHLSNPLNITQILWVNLVMDTLAALALGGEPALARYMEEKPKKRNESIINSEMKKRLTVSTVWIFLVSILLLSAQLWQESPVWRFVRNESVTKNGMPYFPELMTVYFCFFIFTAIFNSLNVRSERLNIMEHIGENKKFFLIMGLIIIIQLLITYFGGDIFSCYGLNGTEWLLVLVCSASIIPVDLIRKLVSSAVRRRLN